MQELQKELQEKYKDIWPPATPITSCLWMVGEMGEVIDVIKSRERKCAM